MRHSKLKVIGILSASILLQACTGTVPVDYKPQSYIDINKGSLQMAEFSYMPSLERGLKSNQIENTAMGTILMSTDVDNLVKRATALELERAGINVTDTSQYGLEADILEFKADDLGYSVDWTYAVNYRLYKRDALLIDKVYTATPVKTGKFGMPSDYTPSINEMILSAIEQFMTDIKKEKIF